MDTVDLGTGIDQISDFTVGQDKLNLTGLGITSANFAASISSGLLSISQDGNHTELFASGVQFATLSNFNAATLTSASIV